MQFQFTEATIDQAAEAFWRALGHYRVFALYGEMGAGKTTWVHALCRYLGVKDAVASPTFSIINQYATQDGVVICHMDLYRLKDVEEALQAGVEEALESDAVCWVEWPERAEVLLPPDTVKVFIETLSEKERSMKVVIPR